MSAGNGEPVIRVGRKGRKLFAIGDGPPVLLDVVDTYNAWLELCDRFKNDKGEIPSESTAEANAAVHLFVGQLFQATDLTMTEVLEFLKVLGQETEKLRVFFDAATPGGPSSPGPTELTFST